MRIGTRSEAWQPRVALVTGACPVGLLAAPIGAQRGLDMHVLDRMRDGAKPELARALGAQYHAGDFGALKPGSVNANRRHYRAAAEALAKADKNWLGRIISRRVPLERWREAVESRPDDIKVVVDFS